MDTDDPFIWLEDAEGEAALDWVRRQNARSLARLEADPRYAMLFREALAIVTAADRIAYPSFRGERLTNFWQDDAHPRGLWRATSLASYETAEPDWQTLLDIDALAAAEGRDWVFHGAHWLPPDHRHALVGLSDGGKDASETREFDAVDRRFVPGGFFLSEGKQTATWLDADTLLVARDWGPGTMTASGYPFVLKRLRRGELPDTAEEIFRGSAADVAVRADVLRDPDGAVRGVVATRMLDFFRSERHLLTAQGTLRLPLPLKAQLREFLAGQLIVSLDEPWLDFPAGALISIDLDACRKNATDVVPVLLHAPGPRESIEGVAATRSLLLVTIYREVKGRAVIFAFAAGGWRQTPLPLPDHASINAVSASEEDDRAFLNVTSFLAPDTLYLADLATASAVAVKALPPRFDAANAVVEQFEARSKDGTMVPYFVVRRPPPQPSPAGGGGSKKEPTPAGGGGKGGGDGGAPTVLYGYGGFQVSLTPSYAAVAGKLWAEKGGVWVVANIRGGGEFGPEWHQAALQHNRQRAYDDFIAVAEALIARGITSPRRLGILGGSNGGLLMGVMLTQRPDLFRAVVIQVPLLDMLRFHKLLAGASWIAEYGDPDVAADAAFLRTISPYHNLRPGVAYPEPLFATSTKDDRVHPGHARKMAAKMAAMNLPFLYYENTEGGHSAAATLQERARLNALEFAYFAEKLMD